MTGQPVSRKEFLASLAAGAAVLTLSGLGAPACSRRTPGAPLTLERGGVRVGGKPFPLYSGSFHYWRHESTRWPAIFDSLSRLGLNTICTSIPWEVHELSRGRFDFGSRDKAKNLGAFLDLAAAKNFKALVRPWAAARDGLTYCGIPQRVLFDPRVAARTSVGSVEVWHTPDSQFPVPSFFSDTLYEELALFLEAMLPVLVARLTNDGGPVIGLLLDTGPALFQRLYRPYTLDYHPAALQLYRKWLAKKYEDIAELNYLYSKNNGSFEKVEPPRSFQAEELKDLPYYLDWAEFRQWSADWSLERCSGMLAGQGIEGVPWLDSLAEELLPPGNSQERGAESTGPRGKVPFQAGEDYQRNKLLGRALSGMCAYPFSGRIQCGFPPGVEKISLETANLEFAALSALMHGMKGWDCYMAVERAGWLGGPVRRDGGAREESYGIYQRLYRLLRELRFQEFHKAVQVVVLLNESLNHLLQAGVLSKTSGALDLGDTIFSEVLDTGLAYPPEACLLWIAQTEGLLREAGFDWDYGSLRRGQQRLGSYRAAFFPATDYIRDSQLETLKAYVQGGGRLIFGPGKPSLNGRLEKDPTIAGFFASSVPVDDFLSGVKAAVPYGALIHLESPLRVSDLLKALALELPFTRANTRIELALHSSPDGRKLLFAANSENTSQRSDVFFRGSLRFRSLAGGESFEREGKLRVELPPFSIEIWEVNG